MLRIDESSVVVEVKSRRCEADVDLAGTTLIPQPICGREKVEDSELDLELAPQVLVDLPKKHLPVKPLLAWRYLT